jgi:FO synthase
MQEQVITRSNIDVLSSIGWDEPHRLDTLLGAVRPEVARALEHAIAGNEVGFEDALMLARTTGLEAEALVLAADRMRRKLVGDTITYVVNRNINFTNVCFVGCRFCAFSRSPREKDAYFHSFDEIARRSREAWEMGAREVCVQGGLPRDLDPYYYRDLLLAIKQATPEMHIHAFSPMEVVYGVELTGMPLADYLRMLKQAGLGTLPGTAAEILDDDVRSKIERVKLKTDQWLDVIRTAHRLGIRTTSTMMYGHTETEEHWVRHLMLLREVQKETGGFTEFVPLGFVHEFTQLYRSGDARPGPTVEEHLKVHCALTAHACRLDRQHPGVVGEDVGRTGSGVSAGWGKRLRWNVDR